MRESQGVYAVSSLDRLEDLRRMVTSLWQRNKVQVQVMLAKDWTGVQFLKARAGMLSAFEKTVMLDTDVLVRGPIDELFRVAESGKIGIYKELRGGPWNSGVVAFNRETGRALSREWDAKLEELVGRYSRAASTRSYHVCDQAALNMFLGKHPVHRLGGEYNYIIAERSLEDEAKDWGVVKIHHFIHKNTPSRTGCRAYKVWEAL